MSRYIDADILRPLFQTWFESFDWGDGEVEKHTIATAIRTLDSMPTADVTQVVRCKDCRYLVEYDGKEGKEYECSYDYTDVFDLEGFCHLGKREES